MFSLFKKGPSQESEPTFKTRVERFWQWYKVVAARFRETIDKGWCEDLAPEVSEKVDELLPGFAWVFGPGENDAGHSFTLSGEGVLHQQLLAIYCVSRAPKLEGWTFHASRQPGTIDGIEMNIGGRRFNPLEIWITPKLDNEAEKVDITVWHPLFEVMDEKKRLAPVFLFLDEVLGEFGTGQWIGEIKLNDKQLPDAIPLNELYEYINQIKGRTGWKKLPPGDGAILYRFGEPHSRFLRGDTVVGTTMHQELIKEYAASEGKMQDPLRGTGADYVFISIDAQILPPVKQSDARAAIEDALDKALRAAESGRLLGGALGTQFAYIDLILFDGRDSLDIVERVLREQNLPAGTAINFFAEEKNGRRVVL